jgi:hypothetical protein
VQRSSLLLLLLLLLIITMMLCLIRWLCRHLCSSAACSCRRLTAGSIWQGGITNDNKPWLLPAAAAVAQALHPLLLHLLCR